MFEQRLVFEKKQKNSNYYWNLRSLSYSQVLSIKNYSKRTHKLTKLWRTDSWWSLDDQTLDSHSHSAIKSEHSYPNSYPNHSVRSYDPICFEPNTSESDPDVSDLQYFLKQLSWSLVGIYRIKAYEKVCQKDFCAMII